MKLRDFIGGSPLAVAVRLAVLSVLAGILLSAFGITPHYFFRVLDEFARHVYDLGWGAVRWVLDHLLLGAMLVVPVWLVVRLLRARPSGDG